MDCIFKYAMIDSSYWCLLSQKRGKYNEKLGGYPEKPDHTNAVRPFFYYPASSVSGPFLVADGKIQSRLLGLHPRLFLRARRFGHGSLQTLSLRHQPSEEGTEKDQTAYFF